MTDLLEPLVDCLERRDRDGVTREIGRLLDTGAELGDRWASVAKVARSDNHFDHYCAAMECYASAQPDDDDRRIRLAAALAESGRFESAFALISRPGTTPTLASAHLHGTLLAQVGDRDAAIASLRHALTIDPRSGPSWLALAALIKFRAGDADIAAMAAAAAMPRRHDRAPLLHAFGKALDDIGDTCPAFAAISAGAAAESGRPRYDKTTHSALADRIIDNSQAPVSDDKGSASRSIFVLGLPRSGTSLVEQILVSHSAVKDGGELNFFAGAAAGVRGPTARDAQAYLAVHGSWQDIRRSYDQTLARRFGPTGRIVDKSLAHTPLLGLIASVFPDAPLVWVRRDPLDTAWSCFKTYFPQGLDWTRSLVDIADYFTQSDRLLAHWSRVLGSRLLIIDYEVLVTDFDAVVERLLTHCELQPEPGTARFHENRRPVVTASSAQVRRPLNQDAIGSSVRYRVQLAPFAERYRPSQA